MDDIKVIIVTQARIGSTRLPSKILKEIQGNSLLAIHINRLKKARCANDVVIATTFEEGIGQLIDIAKKEEVHYHQGSTDDVLDRFYKAALPYQPDYVVRVTSDCPLLDPELIDQVVDMTVSGQLDYGANVLKEEFPDGQDVEVMSFEALATAWRNASLNSEREHVTPYIRNNSDFNGGSLFKAAHYPAPNNYHHIRMTVDESADFEAIQTLIEHLGNDVDWKTYTQYIIDHPDQFQNQKLIRNEGYQKSLQDDKEI